MIDSGLAKLSKSHRLINKKFLKALGSHGFFGCDVYSLKSTLHKSLCFFIIMEDQAKTHRQLSGRFTNREMDPGICNY